MKKTWRNISLITTYRTKHRTKTWRRWNLSIQRGLAIMHLIERWNLQRPRSYFLQRSPETSCLDYTLHTNVGEVAALSSHGAGHWSQQLLIGFQKEREKQSHNTFVFNLYHIHVTRYCSRSWRIILFRCIQYVCADWIYYILWQKIVIFKLIFCYYFLCTQIISRHSLNRWVINYKLHFIWDLRFSREWRRQLWSCGLLGWTQEGKGIQTFLLQQLKKENK